MVFIVAHGRVSGTARLSAISAISPAGYSQSFTIHPNIVTNLRGQLYVVCLIGGYTTWDANTSWGIHANGPSLAGSVFAYGNSIFASWAFMLGPGTGTITISSGTCSAILSVI